MSVIDRYRWPSLLPLLDRALELEEEERARWLDELRTADPDAAAELHALLAREAAADRDGFLLEAPASLAGTRLGAYTLERPLGHGGMGSVWLARRTDGRFEGRAAIKLLNLALLSAAGQARFRREGSALARLSHPGIARLLDAGVGPGGQPYLVLEHVVGTPLDEYVRSAGLGPRGCVALFLQVLDAVGHAHANLVIHRDLKPSNILVTADGAVKLLDFGIARLLDGHDDEAAERPFTPRFAAPEQLSGETVTTAADLYACGLLLHLLLGGTAPAVGQAPLPLRRDGDLGAVLTRALRRAPEERYPTVGAFADDLRRWLTHEPVRARPDTLGYRLRKLVRRNRAVCLAAAAAAVFAGAYLVTVVRDRERVRAALAEATTGMRRAERVTDFAVGLFESSGGGPAFADSLRARDVLSRGLAQAGERRGDPLIQAQMLDLIGRGYTELGDYPRAVPVLREALVLRQGALGDRHPDVATSLMSLAEALNRGPDQRESAPLLRRALAIRRRHFGGRDPRTLDALYTLATTLHIDGERAAAAPLLDEWMAAVRDAPPEPSLDRAEQLTSTAMLMMYRGRLREAEEASLEALATLRGLYGPRHDRVAGALSSLGSIRTDAGNHAAADRVLAPAVAILRENHPGGHPALAAALRNQATSLQRQGRWEEAEPVWRETVEMYRRLVGEEDLGHAAAIANLGRTLTHLERYDQAVPLLRRAVALHQRLTPPASPMAVRPRIYLGDALRARGELEEAERLLLEGYRSLDAGSRLAAPIRRLAAQSLSRLYAQRGDARRAEAFARAAVRAAGSD